MKVKNIYSFLDEWAPFSTQMSFDNAGLLVGDGEAEVTGITACLDITRSVVNQATAAGHNLIVAHHPVIFSPLKTLEAGSVPYMLAQNGISAICAHTNLDAAKGGVNDLLAEMLELKSVEPYFGAGDDIPVARTGFLQKNMTADEFAAYVKAKLNRPFVRYTPFDGKIEKVMLCSGSGADFLPDAKLKGAQALITGEAKHHELLLAADMGICLTDAGHFGTEHFISARIAERLSQKFDIPVTAAREDEPVLFI